MKEIAGIKAFDETFELVHLPAARIIGKEIRNGGALGNTAPKLWDEVYATDIHVTLEELPQIISKDMFGWTCEHDPASDTFIYIVCALTPAGTPVPEGYAFRDVPETACAKGLFGESVSSTLERAKALGYVANWDAPGCGWNAELYFYAEELNPPKKVSTPWHWLVPVKPMEERA